MTPEIKKILYATDLSQNTSSLVFSYAVDLAKKYDATIVIIHAVESLHQVSYAGSSVAAMIRSGQKQEQETGTEEIIKRIEAFCQKTEDQVGFACRQLVSQILVPLGNPVDEVLKAAEEENCDLIVVGPHQKGFLQKTFLGSVTFSILERTHKPVFVVPMPPEKN